MIVAYMAFRWRDKPGGWSLGLLMIAIAIWSVTLAFEAPAEEIATKVFWSKIQYLGTTTAPVFLLSFALAYTRQDKQSRPSLSALLWVAPIMTLVLAFTNEWHHLIWTDFVRIPGTRLIRYGHGLGFWLFVAYAYGTLAVSSVLLIQRALHQRGRFRGQALLVLIAAIPPWLGNLIYTLELIPLPLDFTPVGFALSGMLLLWSLRQQSLLALQPIARDHVIESMHDGVLVLDAEHRLVDLNPSMAETLQLKERAAVGKHLDQLLPHTPLLACVEGTKHEKQIALTLSHGHQQRHYDVHVSTLRASQQIQGHVVLFHDVTEREQLIGELNAFAHTVAHDLKSPLHVILGYADLLKASLTLQDEELTAFADAIEETTLRSTHIIEELLLLASIRQEDVRFQCVNMETVLEDVQERLAPQLTATHGTLTLPESWPPALGYAPWIEAVWVNYISNALKYGGIPPEVEVGAARTADGDVRFWVRDNGAGLTPEAQARLFTPFTRLDQERAEGTGLGLSIVKRIVEKLGGEAGVESAPGAGSTFWFTLPGVENETPIPPAPSDFELHPLPDPTALPRSAPECEEGKRSQG